MKRFGAVLICLLLMSMYSTAYAQTGASFLLSAKSGQVLFSGDGTPLTEAGAYSFINRIVPKGVEPEQWLYVAYANNNGASLCRILDAQGNILSDGIYDAVYEADGIIYMVKNSLVGALNSDGSELISSRYTQLVSNGEDGFLALMSEPFDERPDGVYYVAPGEAESATGSKVTHGLNAFSEKLLPAVSESGRMGYLNARGEWGISAQYAFAGNFSSGYAQASSSAGMGVIDTSGNWVLTPKYAVVDMGLGESRMMMAQSDGSEALLLDADSLEVKRQFQGQDIYFSTCFDVDAAILYLDDCTQLIDGEGNVLLEFGLNAKFDVWSVMDDRVIVRQGEWGEASVYLYTLDGHEVAGPYQELWVLGEDDGRALFAASSYEVTQEVDIGAAFTSYTEVPDTRKIRVVDGEGTQVIEPRDYHTLHRDESGYMIFRAKDTTGAIDIDGRVIAEMPTQ